MDQNRSKFGLKRIVLKLSNFVNSKEFSVDLFLGKTSNKMKVFLRNWLKEEPKGTF